MNPRASVGVGAISLVENGFASVVSVWNGTSWFPFMFGQSTGGLFIEFSSAALPWALSIEPQEWRTFPSLPCHPSCIELLPQCGEGSMKFGIPESCQNHAPKKNRCFLVYFSFWCTFLFGVLFFLVCFSFWCTFLFGVLFF